MTTQEKEKLKNALKAYKQEVTATKAASQKFLVELGVFTEKGKVRKGYKNLCIPPAQD